MNKIGLSIILLSVLGSAALAQTTQPTSFQPATAAPVAPKQSFSERYGVLSDRNIFVSERRRPRPTNTRPSTRSAAPETFVIRGIVLEGEDLRAYVESSRGGSMIRLAPGDTLARGVVAEIQADAVLFGIDGQMTWIEIGHDLLSGKQAIAVASATQPVVSSDASGSVTTTAPTGTPPAAETAGLSVEERLRLRGRRSGAR